MASFNSRKRRKTFVDPLQKRMSQFFTPRAGISKEAVHFAAKNKMDESLLKTVGSSSQCQMTAHSSNFRAPNSGNLLTPSSPNGFASASSYYKGSQSPKCKIPYQFGHHTPVKRTYKQSRVSTFLKVTPRPERPREEGVSKREQTNCKSPCTSKQAFVTQPGLSECSVVSSHGRVNEGIISHETCELISKTQHEGRNSRDYEDGNELAGGSLEGTTPKKISPDTFGLFGCDDDDVIILDSDEEDNECGISDLPLEVLENILCQLPILDLMLNLSCVCRRWYEIIQNPKFIPWKKLYYKVKNNHTDSMREVFHLLHREQLLHDETFVTNLARFLSEFRKHNDAACMLSALKTHPKYYLISTFVDDSSLVGKSVNPWSLVGLLCMVCTSVNDVQCMIHCLMENAACLVNEVLECMYCLAVIFFALKSEHRLNPGFHYRVFYAVYLFENTAIMTCGSLDNALLGNSTGQQTIQKYGSSTDSVRLTHEQVHIANHNVKYGDVIKVVAFAGTGKTTTLVRYTQTRPGKKFLNVTYNKSVQEHNLKIYPSNVTCKTFHSLAYKPFGARFRGNMAGSVHINNVIQGLPEKCNFLLAKRIVDTLNNFIASADPCVTMSHVPPYKPENCNPGGVREKGQKSDSLNTPQVLTKIANLAGIYWDKMSNVDDRAVRITHDGYLKLFQLSKPVIKDYDCLLIDEAQDITPALVDILMSQKCAKILVGDPNQQIYSFRGATNGMQSITSTHLFYLTQSFRFGPDIAYVAASILDVLKGVRNKTLVGSGKPSSILGDCKGQLAIITRCNCTLFNEAARVCTGMNNLKVGFAGGLQGYQLSKVMDIYKLFIAGDNADPEALDIKDNFVRKFKSFNALKNFATMAPDPELMGKIKIVENHNIHIPKRIELIQRHYTSMIEHADIVFSTAHKSKGLEFDTVKVADDFLSIYNYYDVRLCDIEEDEKNLVYVAATRAKKRLILNPLLIKLLGLHEERFVVPVSSQVALKESSVIQCVRCDEPHDYPPDCPIIIQRQRVQLQGDKPVEELAFTPGPLCPSCVSQTAPGMIGLVLNTASL